MVTLHGVDKIKETDEVDQPGVVVVEDTINLSVRYAVSLVIQQLTAILDLTRPTWEQFLVLMDQTTILGATQMETRLTIKLTQPWPAL